MTFRLRAALAAVLALLMTSPLAAQPELATIRGRVLDAQGRGIEARIQVIQRATGLERESIADRAGHFAVSGVAPGEVDVVISAQGFAVRRIPGVSLAVGRSVELDVTLQVAGIEEAVTVAGTAGTVDVLGAGVSSVISAREIESLPLNGRNFLELAFLTPGNAPAPGFDPTKAQSVLVSSAGQAGRGGNITIDGMDNNDDVVGGPLHNLPQDAVQEFQVATARYAAELGRSAGSAINVVTRSGGDMTSGSASIFLRDQSLQALPALLDGDEVGDPPFSRQQMSATAGGPIRAGRLFYFGAVEFRSQEDGAIVGVRNAASRTIARSYAPAPLDDLLGTVRLDWRAGNADDVMLRYSGQREEDIAASTLERAIGTASQRQESSNRTHALLASWSRVVSPRAVNALSVSVSAFRNAIDPVEPGVQLTYPSLQAGASFRVPQGTTQSRWQVANTFSFTRGTHQLKLGGQVQRVDARFDLGVFRHGRIELVEDFPAFDRNGDGVVNDDDLLFAVTLRSGRPDRDLVIPDADNVHVAGYVQDDWRVHPRVSVSLGLRYEIDTDVNNISRVGELNPIVAPFVTGPRRRDTNNWGPRVGVNWSAPDGLTSVTGGYGVHYDRVTLQIQSLERGLDGRALPIEVRAGNVFFVNPDTGMFPPFAPTVSNPFTGFILPGAGASGINIIDPDLQNPKVQQVSLGVERQVGPGQLVRVDTVINRGTGFIIGRTVGTVFNPVVGGPDRVVNLESSAETEYRALLVEFERRFTGRLGLRAAYTLASAKNYANDDQIPFGSGPIDPDDLRREFGPAANDRRHRVALSWTAALRWDLQFAGLWTMASGVPMDILMPGGQTRIPTLGRNAGGRQFQSGADLNAFIAGVNASGGIDGELLPFVRDDARFSDSFNALDIRIARPFRVAGLRIEALAEVFNLFNVTNVLGTSTLNYSGFANVLVRDSNDPADPGYLRSSQFGMPVQTAGGVFGSGGPAAIQLGARLVF